MTWRTYIKSKLGITTLERELRGQQQQLALWQALWSMERHAEGLHPAPEHLAQAWDDLRKQYPALKPVKATLSPHDVMWLFTLAEQGGTLPRALYKYFETGYLAAQKLRNSTQQQEGRLLDFGAGYGRVSRFLGSFFPDMSIEASEIKPSACRFLEQELALPVHRHDSEPASLSAGPFAVIYALSVFTHLPQALMQQWLAHLLERLEPGGELHFSFKNIAESPHPDRDYWFQEHSEDAKMPFTRDSLAGSPHYGVAFYAPPYLLGLVEKLGGVARYRPAGMARRQEGMIVTKS